MTARAKLLPIIVISLMMALTGLATAVMKPAVSPTPAAPDIEALLPEIFANWRRIPLGAAVLPAEAALGPGEAVAYRAYEDDLGRVITLVAAYGPPLGDSVRLHRPEACYVAQGYAIKSRTVSSIDAHGQVAPVVHLNTQSTSRREAVSYWLRSGPAFVTGAPESQLVRLRNGFSKPLDGALIRVSTRFGEDPLFDMHERFMTAFAASLSPQGRTLFLGEEAERDRSESPQS